MIKSMLRKNRRFAAVLTLGVLAVGGVAVGLTPSAGDQPAATCMYSCK